MLRRLARRSLLTSRVNDNRMRLATIASVSLAALALAGCVTPRKADLALPTAYETPAAPAGSIALDTWWTAFNDPELTTLIEQALVRNPDIRTAKSRLARIAGTDCASGIAFLSSGTMVEGWSSYSTELIAEALRSVWYL